MSPLFLCKTTPQIAPSKASLELKLSLPRADFDRFDRLFQEAANSPQRCHAQTQLQGLLTPRDRLRAKKRTLSSGSQGGVEGNSEVVNKKGIFAFLCFLVRLPKERRWMHGNDSL